MNGFLPQTGDSFTVLTYGSFSHHFDTIVPPFRQPPQQMTPDYGPNSLTVTEDPPSP